MAGDGGARLVPLVMLAEWSLVRGAIAQPHRPRYRRIVVGAADAAFSAASGAAALAARGHLVILMAGFLSFGVGAGLTLVFDVRMYVRRWRTHAERGSVALATGFATAASVGTRR